MLVVGLAVDSLGNGLFVPLSLIYFVVLTDVPLPMIGVALTVANVVTLPVPLWAGALADRWGPLPLVVAAQVMQAGGYLAYVFVGDLAGILGAATLISVGVRVFWSTLFTAIADYVDTSATEWTKDTWYAVSNGARTAGLAVGGLVTGLVVSVGEAAAYRAVAWGTAACFVAAGLLIAVFVRVRARPGADEPDEPRPRTGYASLAKDRPFIVLIGLNTVYALSSMMLGLALPTVVLLGLGASSWATSGLLAGNAVLIALLSAPVVKRLAGRRRTRGIIAAAVLWAAWSLVLALLPAISGWALPVLIAGTLLFTFAELIHAPLSNALAAEASPSQARGRYLAAFQYSFTFASMAAPVFFTGLLEVGSAVPWLVLAAANLISIAGMRYLERVLPESAVQDRPRAAAGGDRERISLD
jgi:MFS family permease